MNCHLPIEHESERPTLTPEQPCDCLADTYLCPECADKLARYDMLKLQHDTLRQHHRALSHGIATALAEFGQRMPAECRGKLRVVFMEQALPELPEWESKFLDLITDIIVWKDGGDQQAQARRIVAELNDPNKKGYAVMEDDDERGNEGAKERAA